MSTASNTSSFSSIRDPQTVLGPAPPVGLSSAGARPARPRSCVGTGRNLPLYPDAVHVDAIDFSPRMLERASGRPARPNVELRLMDVEQLQWPAESFDTVVSTCVFCSVPHPLRGLIEIRRVLRAGGRALFLEHVRLGAAWLAAVFDWLDPVVSRSGPHINRRTMDTIREAGFVVEREDNLMSDVLKLVVAHP